MSATAPIPPHSFEAERSLLGAILLDKSKLGAARSLRTGDFFDVRHRVIFDTIRKLAEAGRALELVTMVTALEDSGQLESAGGAGYVASLLDGVPRVNAATEWARIIQEKARQRRIAQAGQRVTDASLAGDTAGAMRAIAEATSEGDGLIAGAGAVLESFETIAPVALRWLWPGRVPLGKLSLLIGDPGLGKSLVTLDVAARVTCGKPFPDGAECGAGDVILLSAEDDAADTIRPRLDAAGANVTRVQLLRSVRLAARDGGLVESPFSLERDMDALERALENLPTARLVVIDPISAYLGAADSHVNAQIRGLLSPLAALASRRGVAVIAVSHLRKSRGPAVHRAIASIAFAAAARAVLAVAADPADHGRRLMVPVKQNLSQDSDGLAFRIEETSFAPRLAWESAPVTMPADEILGVVQDDGEDRTARAEAEDWLRSELASEPLPAREVKRRAREAGISPRTLDRAKASLRVKAERVGFGASGAWQWSLPTRPPAKERQADISELASFGGVGDSTTLCSVPKLKERQEINMAPLDVREGEL